jgi:type IV pilus assembly protein PilY1
VRHHQIHCQPGAISVPVDALNPNGFQPYGYLRALKPQPGKNYLIWQGNLKKYNIIDGA